MPVKSKILPVNSVSATVTEVPQPWKDGFSHSNKLYQVTFLKHTITHSHALGMSSRICGTNRRNDCRSQISVNTVSQC